MQYDKFSENISFLQEVQDQSAANEKERSEETEIHYFGPRTH